MVLLLPELTPVVEGCFLVSGKATHAGKFFSVHACPLVYVTVFSFADSSSGYFFASGDASSGIISSRGVCPASVRPGGFIVS